MIAPYCVTKTALLGLTRALAVSLAADNIRVNGIAPGVIDTKFAAMVGVRKGCLQLKWSVFGCRFQFSCTMIYIGI